VPSPQSLTQKTTRVTERAVAANTASPPTPITITVALNGGQPQQISVPDSSVPLLYVLRNQLNLKGPKFGCGFSQCGACTIILNGGVARSCQVQLYKIFRIATPTNPLRVLTLEGLGTPSNPHPLQSAFIDQQAGQCAYCANAMIMGAYAFLQGRIAAGNKQVPTDDEVKQFLSNSTYTNPVTGQVSPTPYLCRCGAHLRIIRAIQEAAKGMR